MEPEAQRKSDGNRVLRPLGVQFPHVRSADTHPVSPPRRGSVSGTKSGSSRANASSPTANSANAAERLASALRKHGIQRGDRVAYLSFNTHQLLEGYYGVVLAHAIVMPLNVRLSPLELKNILNHSGARMLLFENDFAPLVEQLKPACPDIQRFVALDDQGPAAI